MEAITDPAVAEVWVMKSSQVGWTELLLNAVGFYIHQDPSPILLVQPTLEMSEAFSKDRLAPMLRDTPALRDKVADPRARDSGNTLLHKSFPGGHITIAGANSPSGLASRPIRVVLFDEVDRFPTSAGSEGDPVSLGRKRSLTFWNRKVLAGSTPTVKGFSRIEAGFEQTDQRFYMVPCPHCAAFQRLTWAQVRWPDGQPELAVYVCQHCGEEIPESEKPAMLRAGEWRSSRPFNGLAGFHISELYSPWSTWADMAVSFLRAKRLPETLQSWINTSLGESWEDQADKLEPDGILARRESYTASSLPPGVLMLTVGTDVQDDRLEWTVWGWGVEEEAWRVEHGVILGDPAGASTWADHDAMLARRFTTDDGRELPIEAACVDSGGHYSQSVYRYCQPRRRRRVWAIKGTGGPGRLAWPKRPGRGGKGRANVWPVGVDTIKDVIFGRFRRCLEPGPGYIHLDGTTDAVAVEQITSEVQVYRIAQGRRIKAWKPRRAGIAQEQLDTLVYAYAAMLGRGGSSLLEARAGAVSRRASSSSSSGPDDQGDPPPAPPAPGFAESERRARIAPARPRRGGWVRGWK